MPSTGVICDNLTYLGACGMREVAGLQVSFFAGTRDASNRPDFDEQMFGGLLSRSRSSSFGGVDILLTNHWSRGLLSNLKDVTIIGVATTDITMFGSETISSLSEALTPRYHFAASPNHVAFERAPFFNENRNRPASRFVALSEAFNARKSKFTYAFSIAPMSSLSHSEVISAPEGTTSSPFSFTRAALEAERQLAISKKRKFDDLEAADAKKSTQMFFDPKRAQRGQAYHERQARPPEDHQRQYQERKQAHQERIHQQDQKDGREDRDDPRGQQQQQQQQQQHHHHHNNRPRTEYSRSRFDRDDPRMKQKIHPLMQRNGCWFCLSNPNVEEHLVVSVGESNYLALAKGGLTADHTLLIPIEHSPLLDHSNSDLKRYQNALLRCYNSKDMDIIFWERKLDASSPGSTNVSSGTDKNHAALQVLPLPKSTFKSIQSGFDAQLEHFGLMFIELEHDQSVAQMVGQSGYLYLDLPCPEDEITSSSAPSSSNDTTKQTETRRKRLLAIIPDKKRVPLQLPRRVLAQALDQPQREDWKACVLTREQEDNTCSGVKEDFGPFDFTLQE
jgi:hypothetical protein